MTFVRLTTAYCERLYPATRKLLLYVKQGLQTSLREALL